MSHTRVSYQGEPGAFSEQAAQAYFGRKCLPIARETFHEIFEDVVRSRSHDAVVPIENSLFGSIHQNYDLLQRFRVFIVGEIKLRIRINLLALPGTKLKDIREIYSHPQALGQCEEFLRRLNDVTIHPFYDTAGAAKMIARNETRRAGALASIRAARHYGLSIVRRGVESDHRNYTRFLVIGRSPATPKRHPKTSMIFATKNTPGALFKSLAVFSSRTINLLKIESRPIVGRPWEYLFYLDVEVDDRHPACTDALKDLRRHTSYFKNLGSYESGRIINEG